MMRLRQSVEWTSDILAVLSLWLEEQDGHGEIERLAGGAIDRTHQGVLSTRGTGPNKVIRYTIYDIRYTIYDIRYTIYDIRLVEIECGSRTRNLVITGKAANIQSYHLDGSAPCWST